MEFARKHAGYDVSTCVSLINDPRNAFDQIYTVERLGNVVGGVRDVRYINLDMDEIKEIAVKIIQVSRGKDYNESTHAKLIHPVQFVRRVTRLSGSDAMSIAAAIHLRGF